MLYIHCSFSASQPLLNGGWNADNEQCIYNIAHYLHLGHFGGWDADNESLVFTEKIGYRDFLEKGCGISIKNFPQIIWNIMPTIK